MASQISEASRQRVKANQLVQGMTIVEVTEMSFDFATLDTEKLKFVQIGYKGATAVITDHSGRKEIPIEHLKEFDHLQEITNIPAQLKLAKVVTGMGALMEKHGLLEFMVSVPQGVEIPEEAGPPQAPRLSVGSPEAQKRHEQKVEEVKQLLDKVETAETNRTKASSAVEEMLDIGRSGNYSSKGVESMVGDILSEGSTSAMKAIAGLRGSDQTYAHCVDMSVILQDCYADILSRMDKDVSPSTNRFTLTSGFMHDIGKSEVPKDVLESKERFAPDSQEMLLLRNHTTYGAKILTDMKMHDTIINVAHYHHVKKDGSLFTSYPDAPFESLRPLTRLASVVDVYQALIGKRKYKKNWVPGKAVEYIMNLAGSEFDEKMIEHFVTSMGRYPVGSLLRLSTGELAFVLALAPEDYPDRPMVAVVENGQGELISHHNVLDLMLQEDVTVQEVVDHYEHYNESEDQAYRIFESIRLQ
ncbi:MAG: HD domain-containing protein [SAR324 cluster bacterium]|nr:HD domain-containing protein [SAR324 cluster bacterium]